MTARTNWGMPSDFDYDNAVYSIRFWLMMKFKRAGEERWEEIFNFHYRELEREISQHINDAHQKEKLLTSITTKAYNTIPQEFFRNLKASAEQQKTMVPARVSSKKKKRK